jgi:predicted dinucleotide-binding enzyme
MRLNIIGAGHLGRTMGRLFWDNGFCEIGAAGDGVVAERLHASFTSGILAMDAYAFE